MVQNGDGGMKELLGGLVAKHNFLVGFGQDEEAFVHSIKQLYVFHVERLHSHL